MVSRSQIQRQTMIFFLPLNMEAFTSEQNPYSASKAGETFYAKRQLYINPSSFVISEKKFIQPTQTKGGFVVQYWGEDLTTITAGGTTGSSGIEGITILRNIYRHEQSQYRVLLAKRQRELAKAALKAAEESQSVLNDGSKMPGKFFQTAADTLTGGAFTDAVTGVTNAIDILNNPFQDRPDYPKNNFSTIPTLAALATNIDLYYQGEFFRGFFTSFSVTEGAESPGNFTYSFNFTVTRRTGERLNFMPWHRSPVNDDGETMMSQKTTTSKGTDGAYNLSFPLTNQGDGRQTSGRMPLDILNSRGVPGIDRTTFNEELTQQKVVNLVPSNRREFIKKGSS